MIASTAQPSAQQTLRIVGGYLHQELDGWFANSMAPDISPRQRQAGFLSVRTVTTLMVEGIFEVLSSGKACQRHMSQLHVLWKGLTLCSQGTMNGESCQKYGIKWNDGA